MKIIITERQHKYLIEQGGIGIYGPVGSKSLEQGNKAIQNLDPHTVLAVMGMASLFFPPVGPLLSSGFGLADAALYWREGKKKEAAIVTFFSLLPGIIKIVSKIPGIKELGSKGMSLLASKLLTNKALTSTEIAIVDAIVLNQALVTTEVNEVAKNMAKKAVQTAATGESKEILKHVAEHGVIHGAQHQTVHTLPIKKS